MATADTIAPQNVAICNGTVENDTIPSIAYLNSFAKFHFVVPAKRSAASYGIYSVSNPTQENSPFENRKYSGIPSKASCTFDRNVLKSLAFSRKSTSLRRLINL